MRRAKREDLAAVNALLAVFGREAPESDLCRDDLRILLSDDDLAMGAVYFSRDVGRWAAHATSMVVHPDARGRGLSRQVLPALIDDARQFSREHGPMRLFGYSNPTRSASIHLLEAGGWRQIGAAVGEHGSHLWAADLP